jgi:hypothetical protein
VFFFGLWCGSALYKLKKLSIRTAFLWYYRYAYFFGTVSVAGETVSVTGATESTAAGTLSVTTAALSTDVPVDSSVLFGLHEIIPIPAARIKVRATFFIILNITLLYLQIYAENAYGNAK